MHRCIITLFFACTATAQVSYYSAALDGAGEVPPVTTTGIGYATVRLDEPANNVRIFVSYSALSGAPTASHLHLGAAGVNGGVIVPLTSGGAPGFFSGTGTLSAAQVAALKTAGTYLNVHTAVSPGGEIRGQVVASASTRYTAQLSGAQEVPANASAATGTADAFLHEPDNRLVYFVQTSGLVNVTAAHLHSGATGVNGPVMFPLTGSAGSYCGVSPRLSASQVAGLQADATYFNVHTTAFPGGEIRGQLLRDPGSDFVAALDGAQEVPATATAGLGGASLRIDAAGNAAIRVSFAGLSGPPTAAHIHSGAAGVNGPVVVPMTLSGGVFTATFVPTAANLTQLRSGGWYVNIHTAAFPGGEIRGQLGAATLPSTYGPGCPGSSGARPEIGATGFLGVGSSVQIDLFGALPGAPCFLALGFNRDNALGSALPLPFLGAGLNAPCYFLLDPATALLSFADGRGCATRNLPFAFVPALRGLQLYGQWVVADAAANPAGFVASNGLSMLLQ